jgi:hypothetical protein
MRSIIVAVCALVVSCGSEKTEPTKTTEDTTKLTFVTGDFDVPAGDQFECFYTNTITPRELAVNRSHGVQGAGGHHVTVYYTDLKRPAEHHKCVDSEMTTWHMVAGTGGDSASDDKEMSLPEGFAIKVPAGKQLVLQAHYINTTGKTQKMNDSVTLELLEPAKVKQYANYVASSHESWTLPPKSPFETTSTCTLKQDLNIILMLGHMHELGTHYKLEKIDATGAASTLYDYEWQVSYAQHPPLKKFPTTAPLNLPKGTKLRQTCNWNNDTEESIIFPREMCVFFGYYFPDQGELFCEKDL